MKSDSGNATPMEAPLKVKIMATTGTKTQAGKNLGLPAPRSLSVDPWSCIV